MNAARRTRSVALVGVGGAVGVSERCCFRAEQHWDECQQILLRVLEERDCDPSLVYCRRTAVGEVPSRATQASLLARREAGVRSRFG